MQVNPIQFSVCSGLNSNMCYSLHSISVSYYGYANSDANFCNFCSIPSKFNTNIPCLSTTPIMGFSDFSLTLTKLLKKPRREIMSFVKQKYKFGVFGSKGFDFSCRMSIKGENELGLKFSDEGADGVKDSSSSKGVGGGNDEFGGNVLDEPVGDKAKSRFSKGEELMGFDENGRVHRDGNNEFGALSFGEPLREEEMKSRVSERKGLMGVGGNDDDLELQEVEREDENEDDEIIQAMPKPKGILGSKIRRNHLIKRSSLIAKQVIGIQSALSLGFVSQLWVHTTSWAVVEVEVRPSLLSSESGSVLLEDIKQVGDVVLVQEDNFVLSECHTMELETLVGYNVMTPGQRNLGKVRGYTFNINTGTVESLELDAFGYSIIPSSLVSTYALFTEDVLQVMSDTIIVHEAAATRIRRLTKGFLGMKSPERSNYGLEYDDQEADPVQPMKLKGSKARRKPRRRKFSTGKNSLDDELELPMDYM